MISKKTALFCLLILLSWALPCQAVLIGAQAYTQKFSDGPHYVLCLEDIHIPSPHESQQLQDIMTIIQNHEEDVFVIYEGCGPNVSQRELARVPEQVSILTKLDALCRKKGIESFNAEFRPTGDLYTSLPANFKEMVLHAFDFTEREIHAYNAPKELRDTYRTLLAQEKEARAHIMDQGK
ncbi:MAG: hypothetical protein U1E02_29085, partial [Hydrogenophaga sp.]|nr:hypothetical protein [Hydrogenophaga sp.]